MTVSTSARQSLAGSRKPASRRVRTARPPKSKREAKNLSVEPAEGSMPVSAVEEPHVSVLNTVPDADPCGQTEITQQELEPVSYLVPSRAIDLVTVEELAPIPPLVIGSFDSENFLAELADIWGKAPMGEELRIREQSNDESGSSVSVATIVAENCRRSNCEDEEPCDIKLGKLLVELGLITRELLDHYIIVSCDLNLALGRVLIMTGWLTNTQLQWTVQIQALLRDGLITLTAATQIAELMQCSGMTLQRALNCAGYPGALAGLETRATRFGDLLVAAGLMTADDFMAALGKSQELGLAVGRFLIVSGLLNEALVETVLNAQRLIRDGRFEREDAISAIKLADQRLADPSHCDQSSFEPFPRARVPMRTMRLGDLLSLSGVVNESQIEQAVESGLRSNKPIGKVLIDLEIVDSRTIETALALQDLVAKGSLEPIDAAYAMIDVHHHRYSLSEALKRNRALNGARKYLSFEQFLASSELLTSNQIDCAIETARRSPIFASKALVFAGAIAESTAQIALMCHFYVCENMLTIEEALLLFNLCQRSGISIEDAIDELGFRLRPAC